VTRVTEKKSPLTTVREKKGLKKWDNPDSGFLRKKGFPPAHTGFTTIRGLTQGEGSNISVGA